MPSRSRRNTMKFWTGPTSSFVLLLATTLWRGRDLMTSAWIPQQRPAAAVGSMRRLTRSVGFKAISHPSSPASSSSSSSSQNQNSPPPAVHPPTSNTPPPPPPPEQQTAAALQMSSGSSTSSSNHHHHSAISSASTVGRVLEGGKVIDFGAVKASSKAERALQEARETVLKQQQQQRDHTAPPLQQPLLDGILGINQDVIDEVGHDLGQFASVEEIQSCAAYLRSKAPIDMFQPRVNGETKHSATTQLNPSDVAKYKTILKRAYDEAGEVTAAFAKTFYMGTMLLGHKEQRAIWAIYVWCRRTDEIVDAPRDDNREMLLDLSAWEMRLENLFRYGEVVDVYDLCLLDVRIQYPSLDIQPFLDMIRGMLMDVPGLGQDRYDTFDELHLYCYRVAGTVGVMSLPVFGCARGFDDETAREPALSLGVAFQLTNILRDVGEDAVQRGRVYLPQEDLQKFGVTEQQIREQRLDNNYRSMMKFQIARARMYYERARRGVFMLAPASRLPVQSSLDAYGRILDKIEENDYDSLTKRAYVDKWEKLSIIPFSWYRTTELSQVLPLPGEKPVDLTSSISRANTLRW